MCSPCVAPEVAVDDLGDDALDEERTLKVSVPKRLHLVLRSLKVLTGRTISDIVTGALVRSLPDIMEELDVGYELSVWPERDEDA